MKIQIKQKKAIIMPETLKIIIGVLCIIILIYLAYQLYNLFLTKTDLEQARETLKQIVDRIEGLEEGKEESHLITAPKEWYIVAYDEGENSPSQCKGKNCLCVCNSINFYNPSEVIEKCEKEGVCENLDEKIIISGTINANLGIKEHIKIEKILNLGIVKKDSFIELYYDKEVLDQNKDYLSFSVNSDYQGILNIQDLILAFVNEKNSEKKDLLEKELETSTDLFFNSLIEETGFGGIIKIYDSDYELGRGSLTEDGKELFFAEKYAQKGSLSGGRFRYSEKKKITSEPIAIIVDNLNGEIKKIEVILFREIEKS
ncbi:MAG TPA: hypothetical protein VMZ91_10995 [Candidatus Paceibacterota bacterium]|nr:hypothetical protein [Candidatus Paceibacterota bacterium]